MRCRAVPPCSRYFFLQRDAGSSTCRPTNPRGVQPSPEEPLETPTDPQHRAEMLAAERAKRLEKHEQMRALIAWLVEHRFAGKQVDLCDVIKLAPAELSRYVQGCGEDCDLSCTVCEWEACTIVADHGTTCDVCITSDGDLCKGVQRRHLRPVARAVGKRAAAAAEREAPPKQARAAGPSRPAKRKGR